MTRKVLDALWTTALLTSALVCDLKVAFPGEPTSGAAAKPKGIQQRFVPPVAGIDLEQALNYTDAEGLDLAWFYDSFTYPRVFYKPGSRPLLEKIVREQTKPDAPAMTRLRAVGRPGGESDAALHPARLLRSHGPRHDGGGPLPIRPRLVQRTGTRAGGAVAQIAGLPSRLVFAHSRDGKAGHVVTEVYADGKWVLVDQTEGLVFARKDGRPLNVLDFRRDPAAWREADALYKAQHAANRELAKDKSFWDSGHGIARREHPLELFECVGYHNYFVH